MPDGKLPTHPKFGEQKTQSLREKKSAGEHKDMQQGQGYNAWVCNKFQNLVKECKPG